MVAAGAAEMTSPRGRLDGGGAWRAAALAAAGRRRSAVRRRASAWRGRVGARSRLQTSRLGVERPARTTRRHRSAARLVGDAPRSARRARSRVRPAPFVPAVVVPRRLNRGRRRVLDHSPVAQSLSGVIPQIETPPRPHVAVPIPSPYRDAPRGVAEPALALDVPLHDVATLTLLVPPGRGAPRRPVGRPLRLELHSL